MEKTKRTTDMSNKLIIAATLALNSLMIPYALADDTAASIPSKSIQSTTTSPTTSSEQAIPDLSKDAWLKAMTPMLPELICKGFMNDAELKKRFNELKLTYNQCMTMIPDSTKKCQDQIYARIPAEINSESAGVWGKTLGECIGKDFAEKHLIPQS
jgi:hypothetical protein